MTPFLYEKVSERGDALSLGTHPGAAYLGGGTNLVDLMREAIARPTLLVDVTGLSCKIEEDEKGGLRIGAGVKNTAVATDRRVRARFPLLAQAILAGASAQIRNMATVGGNVLQRTRCAYFYDDEAHCNKRSPGSGCDAIGGFNRNHAILGASPACAATHPSDMCVALAALDATVSIDGPRGSRDLPLTDFHRLPGDAPEIDTELRSGELITSIVLPSNGFSKRSSYRKVRDRSSYAFALVSVAAALELDGGRIKNVRLALGGVAHKPWRAHVAEAALAGRPATEAFFAEAAEAELRDAKGLRDNTFKIKLAKRVIVDSLVKLSNAKDAPR
ncbi:xanthine dehydrogenase family protein subunit M [Bradyrhizobium sp. BR 10289]|uniref:FAD binding domain-containing protein n=1 Tax=Bradyrhizobium sp. BR 10289 TaxID=2749993 RepID=UPI001C647C2A|nr:xanthine dehydrogenase family protein subunit M [Bradyrhizobium sp. BR 10289]MBW7970228.1 xanthine dehydrogenase family protein subunit M [Bradyrhizobium sp. BR 10289]